MITRIFKQKGFTLVELLASVVVLVAIGSIIAGIIASSLRGTNKTNNIENIRQNGSYAIAQISKDITYAQTLDGNTTGFSNDGSTYVTNCSLSTPKYIAVRSATGIITKYYCSGSTLTATVGSGTAASIIDLNSVSLQSCSFTCIQASVTDVPIINIKFSIGPVGSSALVEKSNPPITFETSVAMRNYGK